MDPEIVTVGADRYVRALADRAGFLREYLLRHGVPCAAPEPCEDFRQSIRLGKTANLGQVQALLDRWGVAGQAPPT